MKFWGSCKVPLRLEHSSESGASHEVLIVQRNLEHDMDSWAALRVLSVPRSLDCPKEPCASYGFLSVPRSLDCPKEPWASYGVLSVPQSLERPIGSWFSKGTLGTIWILELLKKSWHSTIWDPRCFGPLHNPQNFNVITNFYPTIFNEPKIVKLRNIFFWNSSWGRIFLTHSNWHSCKKDVRGGSTAGTKGDLNGLCQVIF